MTKWWKQRREMRESRKFLNSYSIDVLLTLEFFVVIKWFLWTDFVESITTWNGFLMLDCSNKEFNLMAKGLKCLTPKFYAFRVGIQEGRAKRWFNHLAVFLTCFAFKHKRPKIYRHRHCSTGNLVCLRLIGIKLYVIFWLFNVSSCVFSPALAWARFLLCSFKGLNRISNWKVNFSVNRNICLT